MLGRVGRQVSETFPPPLRWCLEVPIFEHTPTMAEAEPVSGGGVQKLDAITAGYVTGPGVGKQRQHPAPNFRGTHPPQVRAMNTRLSSGGR